MLTATAPALAYEPVAPGVAALEMPLTVSWDAVSLDGTALAPPDLSTFGLVTYRRLSAGALREVWAPQARTWLPDPGTDPRLAQPLAFRADQPRPWQGIVVAAGPTDRTGAAVFARGAAGFPSYAFAGVFVTPHGDVVQSPSSTAVSFAPLSDRNLMVLGPGDGEQPANATQARVLLRSPALATIGGLVVRRDSPGAEVTLSNAAGASVVLAPDGSILLRPASGRGVRIDGDVETGRVTYQPAGGGLKVTLP